MLAGQLGPSADAVRRRADLRRLFAEGEEAGSAPCPTGGDSSSTNFLSGGEEAARQGDHWILAKFD